MLEPSELFPEVPNLYEFLSVHSDMLFDEERVQRYSEAIKQEINDGDIVVDIGTGTGLLAFLCIHAGAKRVHAIERSAAIKWAKKLTEHQGLSDRIIFHNEDSRKVNLPERADAIVSELIGHIAFEEGMIESISDAKKRFLNPGGKIIPQKIKLNVAPVFEKEIYKMCIECWESKYGIDFSLLKKDAVKACYLTEISDKELMAVPQTIFNIDLNKNGKSSILEGSHKFKITRKGEVNGIALWFDALLAPGISLSSGPWKRTHWQQCFAPIEKPLSVNPEDVLNISINMQLKNKEHDKFKFNFKIDEEK